MNLRIKMNLERIEHEINNCNFQLEQLISTRADLNLIQIFENQIIKDFKKDLIDSKQFDYFNDLIAKAIDGDEIAFEDIKIELGYDTILKDWNIERERAGVNKSTINA